MAWIAISGWILFVALMVIWLAVQWHVRRRAQTLVDELGHIGRQPVIGGLVTRSKATGSLSSIQQAVNQLLQAVHNQRRNEQQRELVFRRLAESVQEAIVVHREVILYTNPQAASWRGVRQADLMGSRFSDLVHPDQRNEMANLTAMALRGAPLPEHLEVKLMTRHGDGFWVEATLTRISYEQKPALLFAGFNINRRKIAEDSLRAERDRALETLAALSDAIVTTDEKGRIDYINPVAEPFFPCSVAQARGQRLSELVQLVDDVEGKPLADPVMQALEEAKRVNTGRHALLITDGKERPVELTVSPIGSEHNGISGTVTILRDMTESRGLAREMSYQATHDPLTGLLNRRAFEQRVEALLQELQDESERHVLCYLDLDRFKAVNDTCGHLAGDSMLREAAQLLKQKVRDSDSVARLGGDEFGVILHGCPLAKAGQIAQGICQAIEGYRFVWHDQIFNFGVSIGLVEMSHDSSRLEDLLAAADSACYMAKQGGRGGIHIYSAQDEVRARSRGEIAWLQRLQYAINHEQFELYAQPIASTSSRRRHSPVYELLLRMQTRDGRRVLPKKFLPTAERYQLMPSIDRWVVRNAFLAISSGGLHIPPDACCAINLSGQTMGDTQFLEFVVEALDRYGIPPGYVCFEIGELAVSRDVAQAHRFIDVLHGIGCRFGLDDFGSGTGALSYLKTLAMDYIKLDGHLIEHFEDPVNRAVVQAIIDLSKTLDILVIAEQVESQELMARLRTMGIEHFQGYAVAYPMPIYHQSAPAVSAQA